MSYWKSIEKILVLIDCEKILILIGCQKYQYQWIAKKILVLSCEKNVNIDELLKKC
jgi:hypothetical protein